MRTITVVHAPACHLCADAQEALTVLGHEIPIEADLAEANSAPGTALAGVQPPTMSSLRPDRRGVLQPGPAARHKARALLDRGRR